MEQNCFYIGVIRQDPIGFSAAWPPSLMTVHALTSRGRYSLLTLPLQQEVTTEAALALVPDAVVTATHTHRALLAGALGHPALDLVNGANKGTEIYTGEYRGVGTFNRTH